MKIGTTVKLRPDQFWKLRALLRDVENKQREAEAAVNAVAAIAETYMRTLGLKMTVNYKLDDATCSLSPMKNPPAPKR